MWGVHSYSVTVVGVEGEWLPSHHPPPSYEESLHSLHSREGLVKGAMRQEVSRIAFYTDGNVVSL